MASENRHHQAIDRLAEQQYGERMAAFRRNIVRSYRSWREPEREATNADRLEWARRDYAYDEYDKVIATASRVIRSPDASSTQTAEALRLRAVARAKTGSYSAAVTDAEDALALDPEPAGVVPAAALRSLISSWKLRPPASPLFGL